MAKGKRTNQAKAYTVSDGDLVLELTPAGDGWYCVTTPMDPGVVTQAKTVPEAFTMARDAIASLREARARYFRELRVSASNSRSRATALRAG